MSSGHMLFKRGPTEKDATMVSSYKELIETENANSQIYPETFKELNPPMNPPNDELSSMKELLLIHLDFIQQQSEQLHKRDKLINDLKNENELLKLRFQRMERRVSLHKNKASAAVNGPSASLEGKGLGVNDHPALAGTSSGDGRKKRQRSSDSTSNTSAKGRKTSIGDRLESLKHNSVAEQLKRIKKKSLPVLTSRPADHDEYKNMTTNEAYYTTIGERECLWGSVATREGTKTCSSLEVPSWRRKSYSPIYTTEGIENLKDDVFEKRHSRPLADEKKIKRWDVRRIREEWNNEKLRQREKKKVPEEKEDREPESFWPSTSAPMTVVISDSIPVCIFGLPIPNNPVIEFKLPWLSKRPKSQNTSRNNKMRRIKR